MEVGFQLVITGLTFFAALASSYFLLAPFLEEELRKTDEDAHGHELGILRTKIEEQLAELESDRLSGRIQETDYLAMQGDLLHQLDEADSKIRDLSATTGKQGDVRGRRAGAF